MSDAAIYGYAGMRADGTKLTATGSPSGTFASVQTFPDAASFYAAAYAIPAALPIDLVAYAKARLAAALAGGKIFNVAAPTATDIPILCDGEGATFGNLSALALFGQQTPNGTKTWVDNDGVSTVLTGADFVTLLTLVGTWSDDLYAALGTVLTGISAGSITTTAAIDAAFAGVTS